MWIALKRDIFSRDSHSLNVIANLATDSSARKNPWRTTKIVIACACRARRRDSRPNKESISADLL